MSKTTDIQAALQHAIMFGGRYLQILDKEHDILSEGLKKIHDIKESEETANGQWRFVTDKTIKKFNKLYDTIQIELELFKSDMNLIHRNNREKTVLYNISSLMDLKTKYKWVVEPYEGYIFRFNEKLKKEEEKADEKVKEDQIHRLSLKAELLYNTAEAFYKKLKTITDIDIKDIKKLRSGDM